MYSPRREDGLACEEIVWWGDGHGRGVDPEAPGARRCNPADLSRIVAYGVLWSSTLGRYVTTIRPDLGHRPERITRDC